MSRRPRHPKPDRAQKQIVQDVRDVPGFEIFDSVSKLTDAQCPGDALVHCIFRQRWQLFEIKTAADSYISPEQQRRHDDGSVPIVRSAVEIIEFFN